MKNKLHLIDRPADLIEGNNFWNCCPILNDRLPTEPCPEGRPKLDKNKVVAEPRCPWWLNSEKDSYCFWKYVKRVSKVDGSMPELSQSELAKLLGWSNTKTHFVLKEALDELVNILKFHQFDIELSELQEFFGEDPAMRDIITNSDD